MQIHGEDGEWIHNVHLLQYRTEQEFWKHYKERYSSLFTKAEEFMKSTGGPGDDVMVFIRLVAPFHLITELFKTD